MYMYSVESFIKIIIIRGQKGGRGSILYTMYNSGTCTYIIHVFKNDRELLAAHIQVSYRGGIILCVLMCLLQ